MVVEDTDSYLAVENEERMQCLLAAVENNAVLFVPPILENDNSLEVEVVVGIVKVLMFREWVVIADW